MQKIGWVNSNINLPTKNKLYPPYTHSEKTVKQTSNKQTLINKLTILLYSFSQWVKVRFCLPSSFSKSFRGEK
ncbi:hypothetical protein [Sulfolobus spindle-shaped virus]|nr:hypothetical protein [Sulfolobus spindle-shaped virus]AZG03213.1 hypothetical protein [Sulfolobus spindle-shaped virus]AZG03495.1 hypothetical protein [Sulfolobus spindle-shaped virus]